MVIRLALGAVFFLATSYTLCGSLGAQESGTKLPGFEIATVKPSGPDERILGLRTWPGGRITIGLATLKTLIQIAYGVEAFQVDGGPKWIANEQYSVDARPVADERWRRFVPTNRKLPPPKEEFLMLQRLLIERFKLKTHEEVRNGSIFELVVREGGPKLKEAVDKNAYPVVSYGVVQGVEEPNFIEAENATMAMVAGRLSRELERPVLDRSGVKGSFDFKVEYDKNLGDSVGGESVFTAIQQLGLKLVAAKGPVLHLVIDHAERPSEK